MSVQVLLIEDDETIAEPLAEGVGRFGVSVDWVATGADGLKGPYGDAVLLDLGLPDMDGLDVCRGIRRVSDVPIIILSARGEETDRILGLDVGADDYLAKPFSVRELVARIRAVSRRLQRVQNADLPALPALPAGGDGPVPTVGFGGFGAPAQVFSFAVRAKHDDAGAAPVPSGDAPPGSLVVDPRTRQVWVDGNAVALTPKEFDLLALLHEDPGAVYARREILDRVWDAHYRGPTKTLDAHVAALRRKLGHPEWIQTLRGVGFRLALDGTAGESGTGRGDTAEDGVR
ncbi:response regulator transcription factor [Streptomyces bluensis]|uniref:response regulator transcription factor n=1 Tax=Streptomyces bluensis TaxID=33897 RepID=UPI001062CBFF|nr:response regulator transcription factor [Streptomyces bluensis]GGZ89505.1 DNA-binding response regulator [Streptomyces bluensis]